MKNKNLRVELIPSTAHYQNLRNHLLTKHWNKLRKEVYKNNDNNCEVCYSHGLIQGYKHRVECHELWEFEEETQTQFLVGMIALCPNCHRLVHAGRTFMMMLKEQEEGMFTKEQTIRKIEDLTEHYTLASGGRDLNKDFDEAVKVFNERSKIEWKINFDILKITHPEIHEHISVKPLTEVPKDSDQISVILEIIGK